MSSVICISSHFDKLKLVVENPAQVNKGKLGGGMPFSHLSPKKKLFRIRYPELQSVSCGSPSILKTQVHVPVQALDDGAACRPVLKGESVVVPSFVPCPRQREEAE